MAVSLRWGSYVETDLRLTEFLHQDHTLSVYLMPQFPYSTSGPVLVSRPAAAANAGWFQLGQGNFSPVSAPCSGAGPSGTHTPQNSGASEYLVDVEKRTDHSQDGWRLCLKCHLLFFVGNGLGVCAAGSGHLPWGSARYRLLLDLSAADLQEAGKVQDNWRWCRKCQALVWPEASGACPAGGLHDPSASGRYALRQRPVTSERGMQAGWNWCPQCAGLHFGGVGTSMDLTVGGTRRTFPALLRRGQWHHLALVRHANQMRLYVDGRQAGNAFAVPATTVPPAMIGLGRTDPSRTTGTDQFYGLVDDVAVFNFAFTAESVANLARQVAPLTGDENGLVAGWPLSSGPHPTLLGRPVTLRGGATILAAGSNRDSAADASLLPLPAPAVELTLPLPAGEVWGCGQSVDDPNGTHRGGASFCFDFLRLTPPSSDGAPFFAPASGVAVDVTWSGHQHTPGNEIALQTAADELVGFSHHRFNSATVEIGEMIVAGQQLALTGNTGTGSPHIHVGSFNPGGRVFASAFSDYEVSRDEGRTWSHVFRGVPAPGEWVRNPVAPSPQAGWRWCARCGSLFWPAGNSRCFAGGAHDPTGSGTYTLVFDGAEPRSRWCRRCGVLHRIFSGNQCPAGGLHDPTASGRYSLTMGGIGHQSGWGLCLRCGSIHFALAGSASRCSTGGAHDAIDTSDYTVVLNAESTPFGQDGWKHCEKCHGLYFGPGSPSANGVCPASGKHNAGPTPPRYQLLHDLSPSLPQPDWRWCRDCQGLFYGGGTSRGTCPAGADHDPTGSANYRVLHAGPQAGQQDWRWCSRCQGLFRGPAMHGVCPAGGPHDPTGSGFYRFDPLISPPVLPGPF